MSKVLLGMSGGVDSSVAAYLLQQQGHEVIGITMDVGQGIEKQKADIDSVVRKLDIEHHYIDLKAAFRRLVIDYFVDTYKKGMTPNPCVVCNKYIKFGLLMDEVKRLGADYMATGHYAQSVMSEELPCLTSGRGVMSDLFLLRRGVDKVKDQSYFLYRLNQDQLSKVLFPLGKLTKKEVRNIAKEIELEVSEKKDSLEVCFIEDNNYRGFLKGQNIEEIEGNFVDKRGKILGRHNGIINYTIGQRRGLGIPFGKPMFVVAIDTKKNVVVLGEQEELLKSEFIVTDVSFTNARTNKLTSEEVNQNFSPFSYSFSLVVGVRVRSQADITKATIEMFENGKVKVIFEKAQRAVTPGQSAVFYDGDIVLGGGIII